MNVCVVDGSLLLSNDPEAATLAMLSHDQNITHTLETKTLGVGDYYDFDTPNFNIRIILKGILETDLPDSLLAHSTKKQLAAHVGFVTNTMMPGLVHGGLRTKRVSLNEYLLPTVETEHDESRTAHFFYLDNAKAVLFRMLITHINLRSQEAELRMGYFRYIA